MTVNAKIDIFIYFLAISGCDTHCAQITKIDRYNLLMKFSTLNIDLNGPLLDPIGSKWPAHESSKDGYP